MTATLPRDATQVEQRLRERLQPSLLEVIDESALHAGHAGAGPHGYGTHMRVRIASPLFEGQSRVVKHRLVYDALRDFLDSSLHALTIEFP